MIQSNLTDLKYGSQHWDIFKLVQEKKIIYRLGRSVWGKSGRSVWGTSSRVNNIQWVDKKKVAPIKIWLTLVIMDIDYQNVYESCVFVFTWYAVC